MSQSLQPDVPAEAVNGNICEYFPWGHGTQPLTPDAAEPVVEVPNGHGRHTEYVCSYLPGAHVSPSAYAPGATSGTSVTEGENWP